MLKGVESEEEGVKGSKREREEDIEEEEGRGIKREREGDKMEEKGCEVEEEGEGCEAEEEEDSESEMDLDLDRKEESSEAEEEEDEDTCIYSEYEDRSSEPPKLDIDSEDEGDEDIRSYCLHMWRSEDFDAPPVYIKGRYISVIPPDSPYRESWWKRAEGCAEFAVKHYNKNRAGPDVELEFSKLTNATSYGWCFFNVTFEAINKINGEQKVYQAKVERDLYNKFKVVFFRKKHNI
ncbi:hypothetical protein OROHE_003947 [Orobanche hederae]